MKVPLGLITQFYAMAVVCKSTLYYIFEGSVPNPEEKAVEVMRGGMVEALESLKEMSQDERADLLAGVASSLGCEIVHEEVSDDDVFS